MPRYISPAITRIIFIKADAPVLGGSVVVDTSIKAMGQETDGFYDAGGSSPFNHEWQ